MASDSSESHTFMKWKVIDLYFFSHRTHMELFRVEFITDVKKNFKLSFIIDYTIYGGTKMRFNRAVLKCKFK